MEQNKQSKDQMIKVSISRDYNLSIEQWINLAKEKEPNTRLSKQKVIECAIDKLMESDLLSLAQKNKDRKAIILGYLKEDKNIQNPGALISLLQKEISSKK